MTERSVTYMALDEITVAPRNPKGHDLAAIGRSVSRFGFTEPIVLDERTGRLVAGHGRLEHLRALEAEGATPPDGVTLTTTGWTVPVIRGWASNSDEEAEAYLVASNRLTELGGWDDAALADLLSGMGDILRETAGFTDADLDLLLAEQAARLQGPTDPDAEWVGMPSADNQDRLAAHTLTIYFPTDADADRFFKAVVDRPKAKSMWWPHHDGHSGSSMREQVVAE